MSAITRLILPAVVATAALTAFTVLPASAAPADPAPTAAATAQPAATADPTPSGSATPAPVSTQAPTPSATPTPSALPAPSAAATPATDGEPTLAEMNTARDHAMGSTVPQEDRGTQPGLSARAAVSGVLGMDVSGWQPNVNWPQQYANGARFVYIKATEGTDYRSSQFPSQYNGSAAAGLIRGAYHFASPNTSDGATQARYFVANGGGWSPDGRTLPPLLDIEYNPYTATDHTNSCWGLSAGQMQSWISAFVSTVRSLTGVNPAIYSTTNWWNTCTGSASTFGAYPLFVACYCSGVNSIPASWLNWTMWQYADAGTFPGDQDVFNGSYAQLQQFAFGGSNRPPLGAYDTASVSSGQPFTVTGWSFDQTNLKVAVQVRIDWSTPAGNSTTTVSAGLSRPDVGAAYPAAGGSHGFTTSVPWSGPGQYGACVTALALPGGTAGNASLGCRTAFTSPATAVAPASQRLAGSDRFETAVSISRDRYPSAGVPVAYVASGLDYPDALAAAPAAAAQHGPVLLTTGSSVPPSTLAELQRLKPQKIVVVGGTSAVGPNATAQLSAVAPVTRVGGSDRYETAQAIAAYAFPGATKAYVATGFGFADALSAGPVAAKLGAPLLLVGTPTLDAGTARFFATHSIRQVTIVGGTGVVAASWAQGAQAAGLAVTRVGGSSRFETSTQITATAFGSNSSTNVYIASGVNWPDALVAAAAAGSVPKPLLLSNTGCVPRTVGDQLVRLGTSSLKVVGGTSALTSDVNGLAVCFVG
ncbi:cell wall-binding repeat-containing protein [Leifsonia sp. fls2-241-R2A-40a]|uniref:cell wall-binding repeat-containing protein n=1 Tax=Leifsonia sp. fls2-241-R2A-40a TaxID=3040290 RepID=UPI00254F48E3|nr:cell wall-binding repeat-containing protein [Leifsonia sp. fls2-241-R2A-40a]